MNTRKSDLSFLKEAARSSMRVHIANMLIDTRLAHGADMSTEAALGALEAVSLHLAGILSPAGAYDILQQQTDNIQDRCLTPSIAPDRPSEIARLVHLRGEIYDLLRAYAKEEKITIETATNALLRTALVAE